MPDKIENIIKDLITKQVFKTQGDLVAALKSDGVIVKQSTVSRILHRIGAVKRTNAQGQIAYQIINNGLSGDNAYNRRLVHDIAYNEAIIIVKTRSGSAGHVAQYIDEQGLDAIMGTIAGDNSILVLPTSVNIIDALATQLRALFQK